jgi:CheY-like chemotaxis protein
MILAKGGPGKMKGKEKHRPCSTREEGEIRESVRILVVEDNAVNRKVALKIIEKIGFETDAVINGVEALHALESRPYDMVFMDCQMPELDGYDTTRVIRDPASAVLDHEIPVIAMTANAVKGDRGVCFEAGMDDYLAKPINLQALTDMIAKWVKDKALV